MKSYRRIFALVLILLTIFLSACNTEKEAETFYGVIFPVSVYEDITVESAFLYDGEFPKDGSFEEKENVLAIKVRNNSGKALQLVRIYVTTDQKEMFFEITTLPVNMAVTAFEKNAQTLSEDEKITDIRGENRVDFEKSISLERETFEISAPGKVFNVRNITDKDIDSPIYLYYKKKGKDGDYFGGITFRTKVDGLKAGELKQVPAPHFDVSDSEVIFVDYAGE